MLILLRCQVHMEIARIEEKSDRVETAMEHLEKAINLDNNGQYHEYLKMAFHRLSLNTMLYKSLERLEDQASLMIEQVYILDILQQDVLLEHQYDWEKQDCLFLEKFQGVGVAPLSVLTHCNWYDKRERVEVNTHILLGNQ